MSTCSPRQFLLATTTTVRPVRPRKTSSIPPLLLWTSRQVHSHPHERSSTSPLSRRNAHALASHSRYNERLPPPPTPSSSRLLPNKKPLDSFAPRDGDGILEEIEREAFPTWESRDELTRTSAKSRRYIDVGETVYADDLDGDVEMDWDDRPKDWEETIRTGIISVGRIDEGKGKAKEMENELMESIVPRGNIKTPQSARTMPKTSPPPPPRTHKSPFTQLPRSRSTKGLLLQPCQRLPSNTVLPYLVPDPLPPCPVHPSPQPHELPLVSRSDWRLSSPLRKYLRSSPPSLYSRAENDTKSQGHNRLVGIGLETSRIARSYKSRDVEGAEPWGWKVKVKESEKGTWTSADQYRKRLDRLLSLSRKSDEDNYRLNLARQGTPSERELDGKTLCRAIGTWLTDSSRAEEIQTLRKSKQDQTVSSGMNSNGAKAVASFRSEDGRGLTEDLWDFASANTIVRITRAPREDLDPNGPQPAPSASSQSDEWYVQGTVLEARDTQLVVAFEESDMWPMNEEDVYQVDIGLDESSYNLQEQAINNLYFDPSRQRLRNATHVQEAQESASEGASPTLREWTLQGTDLRELIVPKIEETALLSKERSHPSEEDLFDESPAAELAHLPSPESLLNPDITLQTRNSSSRTLHPSDLITQNQLINSWAQRYMRDDPMILPGDPELGLNASQTKAVAMAMGEKLSLIQGPPGTGKSQTIVSLIALLKLHFRIPQPILLAAPTHVSTDHLLSLLVRRGLNPLRCGKPSKVSPEIEKWTIEKRQEQHPLWARFEETRIECELLRDELKRSKDQTAGITEPAERKLAELRDSELEQRYRKMWRKYIVLEQRLYSSLLATADVFCATALGSGASKVLNMIDFPIVFLDEAAMCTEPVTLVPLMKGAQQVTLIGDHKQLPAVVSSQEAKKERLQISLFERLLVAQNVKSVLLDTQYRMRPAISAFPNLSFYRSALHDATSVSARPPPPRSRFFTTPESSITSTSAQSSTPLPVAFVSHSGPESVNRRSTLNRVEVDLILEIVGDLLERNPALDARDIGIISPYFAQTQLLLNTFESGWAAKRLARALGRSRASELRGVEINTVDGFQGREKKVIILSTVRSNKGGWIGFLTDKRRLNVALTRAKDALFIVGNKATLRMAASNEWMETDPDSDPGIWRRFLMWCEQRGLVKDWNQEGGGATGQV